MVVDNNFKKATRVDVAKLAGVSETTVSFVFSKKRYVSPNLVEKVLKVSKEIGYQPDMIAASMVLKHTYSIAVLTSDIASPLQMEIIKGMQESAIEYGFFINVCGGTKNLERYIDNFIARRIDGVFIAASKSSVNDQYINKLLENNISVIVVSSRGFNDDRVCGLEVDFEIGMKKILQYLKSINHEKIAYVSCFDKYYVEDKRLNAYYNYMKTFFNNNKPIVEMGIPPYESTIETGYELTNSLLKKTRDFTALICSNDLMALGAISALKDNGLKIPQDISVVGMDDILFSKIFDPKLTTINQNAKVCGQKIFRILYKNIIDKSVVCREIVEPDLVIRASTMPLEK